MFSSLCARNLIDDKRRRFAEWRKPLSRDTAGSRDCIARSRVEYQRTMRKGNSLSTNVHRRENLVVDIFAETYFRYSKRNEIKKKKNKPSSTPTRREDKSRCTKLRPDRRGLSSKIAKRSRSEILRRYPTWHVAGRHIRQRHTSLSLWRVHKKNLWIDEFILDLQSIRRMYIHESLHSIFREYYGGTNSPVCDRDSSSSTLQNVSHGERSPMLHCRRTCGLTKRASFLLV